MSSIMRRRSGRMAISVIGGSCLEDEVANSSILKTRRRPHHHPFTSRRSSRALPCAQRPPARAGSFSDPFRTFCGFGRDSKADIAWVQRAPNRAWGPMGLASAGRRSFSGSGLICRSKMPWCQGNRLVDSFDQTLLVGFARSCNVKGCPVINRGPNHWQSDRDIHPGFNPQHLHRSVPLIVVHGDNQIEVAALSTEKQCVRRQGTLCLDAASLNGADRRLDLFFFLPMTEEPMLTGMRIDPTHADSRMGNARPHQCLMPAHDRALY